MIIYKTTNLVNGKQYIGRDSRNNPNYLGSGHLFKLAIRKYGKENFKKEVIEECSSFEQMVEREEYWLNYYNAGNNPLFYNLHNCGCGFASGKEHPMFGKHHSEETKRKISESQIGEKNHMFGKSGQQSPMFGKTHSTDTILKMKTNHRTKNPSFESKPHSDNTLYKMRQSKLGIKNPMFGKSMTTETKKKLSESMSGKNNPMFGKSHSNFSKSKMSESRSGTGNWNFKGFVVCIRGKFQGEIKTAKEWASIFNIRTPRIYEHLNGKSYKDGIDGNFLQRIKG
jgi:group I intron endonuclease